MEPNKNDNQEIDILLILNYFKNILLKIIIFFKNLFRGIFIIIIKFILLIKHNFIIIGLVSIILGSLGYFKNKIYPAYYYEMIVNTNYNSSYDLYSVIEHKSLDLKQNIYRYNKIKISPIKTIEEEVNNFYLVTQSVNNQNITENSYIDYSQLSKRDSLFNKEYKIKDFVENLNDYDYNLHKISINISENINPKKLQDNIINSIETNKYFQEQKKYRLKSLYDKDIKYKEALNQIKNLLNQIYLLNKENKQISINQNTKNNIERDLLDEYQSILGRFSQNTIEIEKSNSVIKVISPMKIVKNKGLLQGGFLKFSIYGFLISILIIIIKRFLIYIEKYN